MVVKIHVFLDSLDIHPCCVAEMRLAGNGNYHCVWAEGNHGFIKGYKTPRMLFGSVFFNDIQSLFFQRRVAT